MTKITLIATAPMGLEAIVSREVKNLGYTDVRVDNGRIEFDADPTAIARCNLWLRTADRVQVKMGEFKATTFEELFEGVKALNWPDWISQDAEFPVDGKSQKSQLSSVPACQSIVKKAVVEKLKEAYHVDWFDERGPLYRIQVSLLKDIATITLDTSGVGLHKRGYRQLSAQAPIKETLAAALVDLSRWGPHRPFIDPFCGSGTIPIEAAMIGRNIAPGLNRDFTAQHWPMVPQRAWDLARQEARDLAKFDLPLEIIGSDIDAEVLSLANYHIQKAKLGDAIKLKNLPVARMKFDQPYGVIVSNPPYGERLGELKDVERAYKELGNLTRLNDTLSVFVLTSNERFEHTYGKKADKKRKLFNGRIECNLYQYLGKLPPRKPRETTEQQETLS
ncbi:THUMP domain-containing class I SAM-dependent RNA methyltransferase [Tumebacillus permanentifrigoris]|uniref:Putative N6-adenine-specific DNA methylase n=1 Tax=Tumebacillus permanentifrigoris TaxID=378543 RepID=A0A316DCU2_9BACL|nr:class I SAM-dependent RNA methyltransferase [Tumebacillus permanentifrigoris]PWK13135.1 putative N6-adenine-specific DNA methylase [Tumebacillus permanentifrigoris]